jgi:hypothetical protein
MLEVYHEIRGNLGIMAQANSYLGRFCSSPSIFPPHIIQGLLNASSNAFASWRSAVSKPSVNQP